jgi:UDP:flavonoid glycosyltransferase YjiC (YdhE family)
MVFYVRHLEPYLNAQQVVKLGAGLLPQPPTPAAVVQALDEVLVNPRYTQAAQHFASRYPSYSPAAVAEHIAATALQLCQARRGDPAA